MIADIITFSRILFSLCLFAFPSSSVSFAVLYLLCGVTDMLDGFIARRLHTESKRGERLDSAADLFFALVYAVKILPFLKLSLWIWIWTAIIATVKVTGIVIASKKAHRLSVEHSFGNKVTGLLMFFLPLSAYIADVKAAAILVCLVATGTVIKEISNRSRLDTMKFSGFLIVVKDIKKAEKYYHDLFDLETLQDNDGNMILSGGLFLQEEKYWRSFLGKEIQPKNNACELYFEEENVDAFYEKLKTLYPETEFVNLPTTHSWGQRVVRFYDLDGNLIEVGTPILKSESQHE